MYRPAAMTMTTLRTPKRRLILGFQRENWQAASDWRATTSAACDADAGHCLRLEGRVDAECLLLDCAANLREDVVGVRADQPYRPHNNHQNHRHHYGILGDVLSFLI